jgi:hypothetical protein
MNLCLHEKYFKSKAQWSFFASSHGKTECDGIGGTAKHLARKESLQRCLDVLLLPFIQIYGTLV